jgi:hypothetical protein
MTLSNVIAQRTVFGKRAIVTDNSSNDAVRITQTGSGNALVVEDTASPDPSPFVIDSTGNVSIGNLPPTPFNARLNVVNDVFCSKFQGGNNFYLGRANGSASAPTTVANGDQLGRILASGHDGTTFRGSSEINFSTDGTIAANSMPGKIIFSTAPAGSSTNLERMRITSAGNVGVGETNPQARLHVDGTLRLDISETATASAGGATLPAAPAGFIEVNINGNARKLPFYAT